MFPFNYAIMMRARVNFLQRHFFTCSIGIIVILLSLFGIWRAIHARASQRAGPFF
jgi:hypothetical protein